MLPSPGSLLTKAIGYAVTNQPSLAQQGQDHKLHY